MPKDLLGRLDLVHDKARIVVTSKEARSQKKSETMGNVDDEMTAILAFAVGAGAKDTTRRASSHRSEGCPSARVEQGGLPDVTRITPPRRRSASAARHVLRG